VRVSRKAAGGGIGIVVIALIAMYFGVDPSIFISQMGPTSSVNTQQTTRQIPAAENELAEFVSVVLADTEDTWNALFSQAAVGPFYCPADQKVYIDLSFYQDLKNRHGAPGDFAQAYVIAHEIGHHVQTLLGISEKVHSARRRVSQVEGNRLSVMQELQADCFAGVWAHHANRARQILEEGDIEEALGAASAIGDDRLQRKSRGYVTPDSFTHGSSAQRVRWFKQGLKSGEVLDCNTFRADTL
jgi:hypothetical protein